MKNRKLILILSLVLALTMSLGGTLAYLTDTDANVNTMVLGNVKIEQHEYQRVQKDDGTYETINVTKADGSTQESFKLEPFEQYQMLLPAVGEITGYDDVQVRFEQLDDPKEVSGGQQMQSGMKNMLDKIVLVENTGNTDAYVRTLFAFEQGSYEGDIWEIIKVTFNNFWAYTDLGTVNIDGNNYAVVEAVYQGWSGGRHIGGKVPGGDWTYNSLAQVYVASFATNEDLDALDADNNGKYDILVLSQAIQADGFENAAAAFKAGFDNNEDAPTAELIKTWFGDIDPANVNVATADELAEMIAKGANVTLTANVTTENVAVPGGNLELNGKELGANYINFTGNSEVSDGVINAGDSANYANIARAGADVTYNEVAINSNGGGVAAVYGAQVTFNSGSVEVDSMSTSGRYLFYAEGEGSVITINGGSFDFNKTQNQKRAYIYADAGTTVYVNGGTFGKASTRSGYTAGILGEGTVIITGGTFGFNPTTWVANGYQAVETDGVWTVSAK